MSDIPTIEEFLLSKNCERDKEFEELFNLVNVQDIIDFTTLHVERALRVKINAMIEKNKEYGSFSLSELNDIVEYPLTNIK